MTPMRIFFWSLIWWVAGFAGIVAWMLMGDSIFMALRYGVWIPPEIYGPGFGDEPLEPPPCPELMELDRYGFPILPEGMDSCVDEEGGSLFSTFVLCSEGSTDPECSCNRNPDQPGC